MAAEGRTDDRLAGHWEGSLQIAGVTLQIDIDFAGADTISGDISIPAQNASDLALEKIEVSGAEVTFAIKGVPGDPTITGNLTDDGSAITGAFTQGGAEGTFTLKRAEKGWRVFSGDGSPVDG